MSLILHDKFNNFLNNLDAFYFKCITNIVNLILKCISKYFRHQISHYTQQLSKDTSHNLKELNEIRSYSSQTDQVCKAQHVLKITGLDI